MGGGGAQFVQGGQGGVVLDLLTQVGGFGSVSGMLHKIVVWG